MKEIGKKVYDPKRQRWFWVYTNEEKEFLKKQMMDKEHIVLTIVSEEEKKEYIYTTWSNGQVTKRKKTTEPDAKAIHYSGIPFNPNRGYNKDTHDWGNEYEN